MSLLSTLECTGYHFIFNILLIKLTFLRCRFFIESLMLLVCYRRIREKYEMEMREVEKSEKQAMDKYNEMKVQ